MGSGKAQVGPGASEEPRIFTVAADEMTAIRKVLLLLASIGQSPVLLAAELPVAPLVAGPLLTKAKEILHLRKQRLQLLSKDYFGEPAWDMLLSLYVGDQLGQRYTVSKLTEASGASMTTALRALALLERDRLISRDAKPNDRRAIYILLSDVGRALLERYLIDAVTGIGPTSGD